MRDGLHKGAPIGAIWRMALKAAEEADWQERMPIALETAVATDISKGIRSEFISRLGGSGASLASPMTQAEHRLVDIYFHLGGGQTSDSIRARAIEVLCRESMDSMSREIQGYVAKTSPEDVREWNSKYACAGSKVSFVRFADNLTSGRPTPTRMPARVANSPGDALPLGKAVRQ